MNQVSYCWNCSQHSGVSLNSSLTVPPSLSRLIILFTVTHPSQSFGSRTEISIPCKMHAARNTRTRLNGFNGFSAAKMLRSTSASFSAHASCLSLILIRMAQLLPFVVQVCFSESSQNHTSSVFAVRPCHSEDRAYIPPRF